MKSPYLVSYERLAESEKESRTRYDATLAFLRERLPGVEALRTALDIGERSPFTQELEALLGISIESTSGDLDFVELEGSYDVILSFEVIEHLFNPLWHLRQLKKCLAPSGRIWLSTPKSKPHFLWSPHHFHEMHERELRALFRQAGLSVASMREMRVHPLSFYFSGLRPLLRLFFERVFLVELRHDTTT
jgi:SAM-dependent methyltransferase